MRSKLICIVAVLAAMTACTGCNKTGKSGNGTDSTETAQKGIITFDTLAQRRHKNIIEGKEVPNFDIQIVMPFAKGDSLLAESINRTICREFLQTDSLRPEEALTNYTDSLDREFTAELKEYYDPESDHETLQYSWLVSGDVSKAPRPNCIAYSFYRETYLGGAHGSHDIYYLNIDAATGRKIMKDDVFKPETEEELKTLIREKLVQDNDCKTVEELIDKTAITMLGDVYVAQNFLLEKDGITFVYNCYEIAPYAAGTIFAFLPYDKLEPYINLEP